MHLTTKWDAVFAIRFGAVNDLWQADFSQEARWRASLQQQASKAVGGQHETTATVPPPFLLPARLPARRPLRLRRGRVGRPAGGAAASANSTAHPQDSPAPPPLPPGGGGFWVAVGGRLWEGTA